MDHANGGLLHNLILFSRVLRGLGFDISPGQTIDLLRALERIGIGNKRDFYHAARCLYVRRREQLPLFDRAFEAFWRKPADEWTTQDLRALGEKRRFRQQRSETQAGKEFARSPKYERDSDKDQPPRLEASLTYSPIEVLRHRDFSELSGEEVQAIKLLMSQLVWRLGARHSRRQRAGSGPWLDLRRSVRQNLRHGGEVLQLARRKPKIKPRPLVIIADVSGSMKRYTKLLLHFVYSLAEGLDQKVEAFVFSTRLTRITRPLRGRDAERALQEVSRSVQDWSGGTRIGQAIKVFNFEWARRVLGHGAVVLVISDGWDRGDIDLLRREMARLQRSSYHLIWLNPLLGSPNYEPLTRGIQAALPFVDDFLPVHNLASLEDLARRLELLGARAPSRRRQRLDLAAPAL